MKAVAVVLLAWGGLTGVACAQEPLGPSYTIREPDMLEEVQGSGSFEGA